ncbi:MAG: hypothetical protein JW682_04210 [Campylobacterales bacterium]|nr:hypothetical protein [Campylobacterales bacterium]HES59437.1 hypothetical protein [Caldithrix sp.]
MKSSFLVVTVMFLSLLGAATFLTYIYVEESFQNKIAHLSQENISLKKKNTALINKQNKIRQEVRNRRKLLITKKNDRAKLKIAKAPASMVPFAGAAVVAGFTAYEINGYCEDIKEYKKFEESLFGAIDEPPTEEEKYICGLNVDEVLLPELKKYSDLSIEWIVENYDDLISSLKKEFDE